MDYKEKLFKEIENMLVDHVSSESVNDISIDLMRILNNYDICSSCKEIIPYENINEKLLKKYIGCMRIDGKSEKTIYQYTRSIQRFSDFVNKPLSDVGIYDVRFFLGCEKDRGISNRTIENCRANLSAFYTWMTLEEIIPKNPIQALKPIKYVDEIKKPFSDIEIDKMRSGVKSLKERALIEFLLATGVRVSELSSMKLEDINFRDYSVHVKYGKGGKERMTYITPVAINHLENYIMNRKFQGDALFYNQFNTVLQPDGIRFILNTISKRSGVANIYPHRFRRTFATTAVRKGLEVQEVQRLLGHENINTTMKYVYLDNENIKASYQRYIS